MGHLTAGTDSVVDRITDMNLSRLLQIGKISGPVTANLLLNLANETYLSLPISGCVQTSPQRYDTQEQQRHNNTNYDACFVNWTESTIVRQIFEGPLIDYDQEQQVVFDGLSLANEDPQQTGTASSLITPLTDAVRKSYDSIAQSDTAMMSNESATTLYKFDSKDSLMQSSSSLLTNYDYILRLSYAPLRSALSLCGIVLNLLIILIILIGSRQRSSTIVRNSNSGQNNILLIQLTLSGLLISSYIFLQNHRSFDKSLFDSGGRSITTPADSNNIYINDNDNTHVSEQPFSSGSDIDSNSNIPSSTSEEQLEYKFPILYNSYLMNNQTSSSSTNHQTHNKDLYLKQLLDFRNINNYDNDLLVAITNSERRTRLQLVSEAMAPIFTPPAAFGNHIDPFNVRSSADKNYKDNCDGAHGDNDFDRYDKSVDNLAVLLSSAKKNKGRNKGSSKLKWILKLEEQDSGEAGATRRTYLDIGSIMTADVALVKTSTTQQTQAAAASPANSSRGKETIGPKSAPVHNTTTLWLPLLDWFPSNLVVLLMNAVATIHIWTVAALAYDRYCAIAHPLQYLRCMQVAKARAFFILLWSVALLLNLVAPLLLNLSLTSQLGREGSQKIDLSRKTSNICDIYVNRLNQPPMDYYTSGQHRFEMQNYWTYWCEQDKGLSSGKPERHTGYKAKDEAAARVASLFVQLAQLPQSETKRSAPSANPNATEQTPRGRNRTTVNGRQPSQSRFEVLSSWLRRNEKLYFIVLLVHTLLSFTITILIPLLIITICNISIYGIVKVHERRLSTSSCTGAAGGTATVFTGTGTMNSSPHQASICPSGQSIASKRDTIIVDDGYCGTDAIGNINTGAGTREGARSEISSIGSNLLSRLARMTLMRSASKNDFRTSCNEQEVCLMSGQHHHSHPNGYQCDCDGTSTAASLKSSDYLAAATVVTRTVTGAIVTTAASRSNDEIGDAQKSGNIVNRSRRLVERQDSYKLMAKATARNESNSSTGNECSAPYKSTTDDSSLEFRNGLRTIGDGKSDNNGQQQSNKNRTRIKRKLSDQRLTFGPRKNSLKNRGPGEVNSTVSNNENSNSHHRQRNHSHNGTQARNDGNESETNSCTMSYTIGQQSHARQVPSSSCSTSSQQHLARKRSDPDGFMHHLKMAGLSFVGVAINGAGEVSTNQSGIGHNQRSSTGVKATKMLNKSTSHSLTNLATQYQQHNRSKQQQPLPPWANQHADRYGHWKNNRAKQNRPSRTSSPTSVYRTNCQRYQQSFLNG